MGISTEAISKRFQIFEEGRGKRLEIGRANKYKGAYFVSEIKNVPIKNARDHVCVHCQLHSTGRGGCCGVDKSGKIVISSSCETSKTLARALCNLLDFLPKDNKD